MTASAQPPELVFMLEEKSAKNFLEAILPQILPSCVSWRCIAHQGKGDLRKDISKKMQRWQNPKARFIILQDQDAADCKKLKSDLKKLCDSTPHPNALVRIACRELESWYWGDLEAVEKAYPGNKIGRLRNRARYRKPDNIVAPSEALERHIPNFQKGEASRTIPKHMCLDGNSSDSFNCLIEGIRKQAKI